MMKLRNNGVEQYRKMLQGRFKLSSLALALKLYVQKHVYSVENLF